MPARVVRASTALELAATDVALAAFTEPGFDMDTCWNVSDMLDKLAAQARKNERRVKYLRHEAPKVRRGGTSQ